MRRILKFVVRAQPVTTIETNDWPRFLSVGTQGEDIVVWCEATPGVGIKTDLGAVMTGQAPPPDGEYIGTGQVGPIVVHVYGRSRRG